MINRLHQSSPCGYNSSDVLSSVAALVVYFSQAIPSLSLSDLMLALYKAASIKGSFLIAPPLFTAPGLATPPG